MSGTPSPPWKLACPWRGHFLTVSARGQRGADQGSGYEAACRMQDHVESAHGKSWPEFLAARGSHDC